MPFFEVPGLTRGECAEAVAEPDLRLADELLEDAPRRRVRGGLPAQRVPASSQPTRCGLEAQPLPPPAGSGSRARHRARPRLPREPAGCEPKVVLAFVRLYQEFIKMSSNFSKILMNFCIQHSIFQHFSKSTDFCKILQKNLQIFCGFLKNLQNFVKFAKKCQTFCKNVQFCGRILQNLHARRLFSCIF